MKIPEAFIDALDQLIEEGKYTSRSEAIRYAIRRFISEELGRVSQGDREED